MKPSRAKAPQTLDYDEILLSKLMEVPQLLKDHRRGQATESDVVQRIVQLHVEARVAGIKLAAKNSLASIAEELEEPSVAAKQEQIDTFAQAYLKPILKELANAQLKCQGAWAVEYESSPQILDDENWEIDQDKLAVALADTVVFRNYIGGTTLIFNEDTFSLVAAHRRSLAKMLVDAKAHHGPDASVIDELVAIKDREAQRGDKSSNRIAAWITSDHVAGALFLVYVAHPNGACAAYYFVDNQLMKVSTDVLEEATREIPHGPYLNILEVDGLEDALKQIAKVLQLDVNEPETRRKIHQALDIDADNATSIESGTALAMVRLAQRCSSLNDEVAIFESDLETLKAEHHQLQRAERKAQARVRDLEAEVQRLRASLANATAQAAKAKGEALNAKAVVAPTETLSERLGVYF